MDFTLFHIAITFFLGFFLGAAFGLGVHYIRSSSQKGSSVSSKTILKTIPERELLPDIPETLVNEHPRSPELDYPRSASLQPINTSHLYTNTTTSKSGHSSPIETDSDRTQDFQIQVESVSLSDPRKTLSVDISEDAFIDDDVTHMIPRKE